MADRRYYTDEEKAELLSNPYTLRVTDTQVKFTLEFKKFALKEVTEKKTTYKKVFEKAGYRLALFTEKQILYIINSIKKESQSEEGLKDDKTPKRTPVKKQHKATEIQELQKRVLILEQQLDFLKKSRHLDEQEKMRQNTTD